MDVPDPDALGRAVSLVGHARRITALTGAGVSTDSGIPDFRGPRGVWTTDPAAERLSSIHAYVDDPEVRRESWRQRAVHPAWGARPGPAHEAFVTLERSGRLRALVTQNVDELHQAAGSSRELVLELHGTVHHTRCLSCGVRAPIGEALARVAAGEDDPSCPVCGGLLKSATVSFGENLDAGVLARAEQAALDADVVLAAGTSLGVYPAAGLVDVAIEAGVPVVIVNGAPTPYDDVAAVVLRGELGDLLPRLVADLLVVD